LLFFTAFDAAHGQEVWVSDGTADGTVVVRDIAPGPASSRTNFLSAPLMINAGRAVLFSASDGFTGLELWKTDGSEQRTVLVADIAPGPISSSPDRFLVTGTLVFFTADDGSVGRELWVMPDFVQHLPDAALRHLPERFPGLKKYPGVDSAFFVLAHELFDEAASLWPYEEVEP